MKENAIRHLENLHLLHKAYYKGQFFFYGEPKGKNEKRTVIKRNGTIYQR